MKTIRLAPLMEFVIRLINNYEDKYVPKLTELFPELAEEAPVEVPNKNSNPPPYASELSDNELAAHAFFSIGCLLWERGKEQERHSLLTTQQFGCNQIMPKFTTTEAISKVDWARVMLPLMITTKRFVSIQISLKPTATEDLQSSDSAGVLQLLLT